MGLTVSIIALALTLVVFVALLGVMREVVTLRGEVAGLSQVITVPPEPDYLGQQLPDSLRTTLEAHLPLQKYRATNQRLVVLFLSSDCSACVGVARELEASSTQLDRRHGAELVVLVAKEGHGGGLSARLRGIGLPVVSLPDGAVLKSASIIVTPAALVVQANGLTATNFRSGVNAQWLLEQLQESEQVGLSTLPSVRQEGAALSTRVADS